MAKIQVRGLKGLAAAFQRAPGIVSERVDKAIAKNAKEMVSTAKTMAPRDTGELEASIGARPIDSGWAVEATAEQAAFVEFGTPPHIAGGKFEGAKHPGQRATPFFFVSYRALRKRFKGRNRRAVKIAISEAGLGDA